MSSILRSTLRSNYSPSLPNSRRSPGCAASPRSTVLRLPKRRRSPALHPQEPAHCASHCRRCVLYYASPPPPPSLPRAAAPLHHGATPPLVAASPYRLPCVAFASVPAPRPCAPPRRRRSPAPPLLDCSLAMPLRRRHAAMRSLVELYVLPQFQLI